MGRSGRHVALAATTAIVLGLVTFAARGVLLPVVDRALDGITLLRVVIALAAIGLLQVVVSLWSASGDRLPTWQLSARSASIAIGALVGVAAGGWSALNTRVTLPTVFADEFIYMSLAKSLSRGDGPLVRGTETLGYGLAYPTLLAPVYALAGDGAQAFTAAQITNAAVMASAAVPAYLLSRMVLARSDSLLVAAFSVGTPLLAYSGYVLTESLFYPAFLWTAYAVARALACPSTLLQIVALGSLIGLCTVRPQAVVLIPAAASAACVVAFRGNPRAGGLQRYRVLLAGLGGAAVVGAAIRVLSDTSPVGAYDVLVAWPDPLDLLVWSGRELNGLALATGVIAVVVFPIATIRMLGASTRAEERALGATSLAFVSWMLASVAVLDASPYGLGWTHLRNLVAVIPLIVLVGIKWIRQDMPRPPATALLGAALALFGALAVRAADLEHAGRHDAPSFLPWRPFASDVLPLDRLVLIAVAIAVIVALTTRTQWALPVSVLAAFVIVAPEVAPREPPWGVERNRVERLAVLDREVSPGGEALVITAGLPDERCETHALALTALWAEVLNISAGARRLYGADLIGTARPLTIAPDGTLLDAGRPVSAGAVAIDERIAIDGIPIATVNVRELGGEFENDLGGLRFWRTAGRVRLAHPQRVLQLAHRKECPVA